MNSILADTTITMASPNQMTLLTNIDL
uniref:APO protein 4-like n=1 Tax=Rhizophora mucronata TaxID=61149 RepID=A0A2P2QMQ4_RHIMU